jgi:6-phosphogluconolactonase (cycloisomerase 2 family)
MKRLIGCMAVLCLVALTVGCGGAASTNTLAYVSNSTGTGFTVFTVNNDGTLIPNSISPQTTPAAPKTLQFSPNGRWAFFLDTPGNNVYGFERAGNGTLPTPITGSPFVLTGSASALAISANSQYLYVALPGAQTGELATFLIDQSTGTLSQVGSNQLVGYQITQLIMSPDGSVLYGLAPNQQAVVTFTLNASTGLATGPTPFPVGQMPPCSGNPAAVRPPCGGMTLSANGSFLYVVDTVATGLFTTNGSVNGVGASFTGQSADIFGFTTATTGVLTQMPGSPFHENADLSPLGQTPAGTPQYPTDPVAGVTTNDSRFLFIANEGTHNISVFKIAPTTGQLTEVIGTVTVVNSIASSTASPFDCGTGCSTPDFLAVSASNNALYALDTNASAIFQFAIDQNTGRLRQLNPPSVSLGAGNTPTWITIR